MFKTDTKSGARDRAVGLGIKNVVAATNTGTSVLAAQKA